MLQLFRIALILLLTASSCQFAAFTDKPGVPVQRFPADMYGSYRFIEKNKGIRDTHILEINGQGARLNDPILGQFYNSSDSNKSLSHLGDFYYLNILAGDSNDRAYFIYPFELHRNNLYIYKLLLSKKTIRRMEKAGLKSVKGKQGTYLMDNEAFKHYVEKHMRRRDALKFTRIRQ